MTIRIFFTAFAVFSATTWLVWACRGDGDSGDGGDSERQGDADCRFICVDEPLDCLSQGRIVEGECPDDGVCCNTEGQGRGDTDRRNDDTEERAECEHECMSFSECPQEDMVPDQACENRREVCCNTEADTSES